MYNKNKMDNFDLKKYLSEGRLFEEETSDRGHSIQLSNPERFFSNDYIATLKNSKKEIVTIFKHPEDNDYYAIIQYPYNKRSMTSFYHEIESNTLDELKDELIKNNFISPEEIINDFIADGELK
jgi:hypothetical protein